MSRIGKKPISIEKDVQLEIKGDAVMVSGPYGKLDLKVPPEIALHHSNNQVEVKLIIPAAKNIQGLFRSLLHNAITGVRKPWSKTLELVGVGYRAQTSGSELVLNLGFSHPVKLTAPSGISFKVKENKIIVIGIDKHLVGEVAASIKRVKPPEPYKGKGIRYNGEYIRKKLGKAAKAVGEVGTK